MAKTWHDMTWYGDPQLQIMTEWLSGKVLSGFREDSGFSPSQLEFNKNLPSDI